MIEESEQVELSAQVVAQKVAAYLKDCHPDGVTLEVDPEGVQRGEFAWRVRVRPSQEPSRLIEYYEALVDIEMELEEREQLQVWLVPSDPKYPPTAEKASATDERKPLHPRSAPMPRRWHKATKEAVAQKVAEYLRDCHPGGMSLAVDAEGIRKEEHWWEVPIRPGAESGKRTEYYDALIAVIEALDRREHLKVFLMPSDPKQPDEA